MLSLNWKKKLSHPSPSPRSKSEYAPGRCCWTGAAYVLRVLCMYMRARAIISARSRYDCNWIRSTRDRMCVWRFRLTNGRSETRVAPVHAYYDVHLYWPLSDEAIFSPKNPMITEMCRCGAACRAICFARRGALLEDTTGGEWAERIRRKINRRERARESRDNVLHPSPYHGHPSFHPLHPALHV
jgi:hypothetical protein